MQLQRIAKVEGHPRMGAGVLFEIRFNPGLLNGARQWPGQQKKVIHTGSVRLSSLNMRRGMSCAVVACALTLLAGCSSITRKDDAAAKLAVQEEVNEHLSAADKSLKAGHVEQAMEQLDAAIKADPAAKAPWLKKAQIHFDAREYGHAITQAQEVLQRDVTDLTAKSILAVSGLRVSAAALDQLRKVNEVNGSARSEAESVAKLIREALGEPILVPATPAALVPDQARPVAVKSNTRAAVQRAVAPRPHTAGAAPAPTAAPVVVKPTAAVNRAAASGGRNNPFGALQ